MSKTLSDKAYRFIIRKLLAAELSAGQKLSEKQLATECGVSRTSMREAIRLLTEEGLLFQIPSSGTYVASPDRRQLSDAFEVRMALECFALESAIRNLTREERQELRRLCEEMYAIIATLRDRQQPVLEGPHLVTFLSDDLSFHLLILKAAGNRLAIKIVTNAYQRNHFFGHHSHRRDLHHLAWVWRHHAKIERAIRRGDNEGARRWLTAHINRSLRDALAAFDHTAALAAEPDHDPVNAALARLSDRFA